MSLKFINVPDGTTTTSDGDVPNSAFLETGPYLWKFAYEALNKTFAGWFLVWLGSATSSWPGDYVKYNIRPRIEEMFPNQQVSISYERQDIDTELTFHTHT